MAGYALHATRTAHRAPRNPLRAPRPAHRATRNAHRAPRRPIRPLRLDAGVPPGIPSDVVTILRIISVLVVLAALFLSGCDRAEPVTYRIPKEERPAPATMAAPRPAAAPAGSGMQVLPGMAEAAASAGDIRYAVPAGWTDLPVEGIRKAHLRVEDADGAAEVTVLVFPGDVGGASANIDRWRRQIGLEPLAAAGSADPGERITMAGHEALYVRLEGEPQSILAAILPFHGETWFFKMQGDTAVVLGQEAAMRAFLASVEMAGHTH